jgi:hypothetical protein
MPESTHSRNTQPAFAGDILFRCRVSVFTALCLAATYGRPGEFVRQSDGILSFHWRWMAIVWTSIGPVSSVYLWRKIWPSGNRVAARKSIVEGIITLAVPGIWWLTLAPRGYCIH